MEPLLGVVVIRSVGIRRVVDYAMSVCEGESGTAGSCFLKESSQNQGLWDFKTGFLYQI